ncbi:hypothetical protein [Sorangium sp. So ce362]|uniref:hypothetical protein n=1 Tax=Sorangium sp. So ce362 TaxID=3133303 RepID=UPI003F63B396
MDAVPFEDHPTDSGDDRPTDPAPASYPVAGERCAACAGSGLCRNCSGLGRHRSGGLCGACNAGDCAACDGVGWRVAPAGGGDPAQPLTPDQQIELEEQQRQRLAEELERVSAAMRASDQRLADLRSVRDAVPPPAACAGCGGSGVCPRCGGQGSFRHGELDRVAFCGCVAGRCLRCSGSGASSTGAP